jgi:DNA-binding response OmpR family regulator
LRKVILIAEDEFGLAEVVGEMLADSGHDVELALNGKAALERMAARTPDLVLVDIMMPLLDGPGLVRRMRSEPALASVPVVLMTALPRAISADITAMAHAILAKPFTPDQLFAAVDSVLRRE